MIIDDPRGNITAYDTFGNPLRRTRTTVTLPMSDQDFFLTTKRDVNEMCEKLAMAKLEGFTPVEIMIPDFVKPLQDKPALRVRLRNALNETVSGKV